MSIPHLKVACLSILFGLLGLQPGAAEQLQNYTAEPLETAGAKIMVSAKHVNKTVKLLHSPDPTRNCFFFQLTGVSTADPAVSGTPWFAVPLSNFGANQIFAMLLNAYATGGTVTVLTTGRTGEGCGSPPEVSIVQAP